VPKNLRGWGPKRERENKRRGESQSIIPWNMIKAGERRDSPAELDGRALSLGMLRNPRREKWQCLYARLRGEGRTALGMEGNIWPLRSSLKSKGVGEEHQP